MNNESKKHIMVVRLGFLFLFVCLWIGGSMVGNATASPRISEEEAIAIATGGEIGPNDFRISQAGLDRSSYAYDPDIAYNAADHEYLVVWRGVHVDGPVLEYDNEIYGQRVDAATGQEVGPNDFRISDMGPEGSDKHHAFTPAVAHDPTLNQYLVVWGGIDDSVPMAAGKQEIYGQFLRGDGTEVGSNDFRLSNMGFTDTIPEYSAYNPDVVFNPTQDQFLVVWEGLEKLLVNGQPVDEYEIYGVLLAAERTTVPFPPTEKRISDLGPEGDLSYRPGHPSVVYNTVDDQYLVLWDSDDNTGNLVEDKQEIYGQLLDANADRIGVNSRISFTGADNNANLDSTDPAGVHNPDLNQYLVVWQRDVGYKDGNDEREVYGQLLGADGNGLSANFRISDMGPDGIEEYDGEYPAAAYNASTGQYLVTWDGDDNSGDLTEDHQEIYGQFLDANGQEVGENDFRITQTGPDSDPDFDSVAPEVAYNPISGQFFVVSQSDVQVFPSGEEDEILGHMLAPNGDVALGNARLSNMGADARFDAGEAAVAYNSVNDEYLVVWSADHNMGTFDEDFEVWGQRIDAATGAEVGPDDFRISDMGPDLNTNYEAYSPAVAFNPDQGQYLVVWAGDEVADGEVEIFGQLLWADGVETGANDFRISFMGPDGVANYNAVAPDVAFNPITDQYIVVWDGVHLFSDFTTEHEVFGRLLSTDGVAEGDQIRISDMGTEGDIDSFGVDSPAVTYNPMLNQYLVVWSGTDNASGTTEKEIYGQLLDATGIEIGQNDFRISYMGPSNDAQYEGTDPDVTYNPDGNQYLVVWKGNELQSGIREYEIYGQLLQSDGTQAGPNDFRISDMGPEGDTLYSAIRPSVAFDATSKQYLVVWASTDDRGDMDPTEYEIFAQALLADGSETGENDLRLSDMGPDGNAAFNANRPAVACSHDAAQCLVVWDGDDDRIPLVKGESEIFGQLYESGTGAPPPPPPPPPPTQQLFLPLVTR